MTGSTDAHIGLRSDYLNAISIHKFHMSLLEMYENLEVTCSNLMPHGHLLGHLQWQKGHSLPRHVIPAVDSSTCQKLDIQL